jgi:hypothetical protein
MTTNAEAPDPGPDWLREWQDAAYIARERERVAPVEEPAPEPALAPDDADEYRPAAVDHRRNWSGPRAAILAAAGVDIAEPSEPEQRPVPEPASPPQPAQAPAEPVELTTAPPVDAVDAPPAYVRKERSWRERMGLPRVKKKLSPSQTTAGRRARYAARRAVELGISYDEAYAAIAQRPQMTRYGRRKAAQEAKGLQDANTLKEA